MNPFATVFIGMGALIVLLAGVGLLKFSTPYARFHAAGKASPVAFLFVAVGAATEVDVGGAARLAVAAGALVVTLPVAVHLLFRAVHRTRSAHPELDELLPVEEAMHLRPSVDPSSEAPGEEADGPG